MPRIPRVDIKDTVYHVINRANARLPIFFKEQDYQLFESILENGRERFDTRILAYCLMPNHFHLVLQPREDGGLQKFMQWVTVTHTQRWHSQNKTIGSGHLYQGRYKSFIIQEDNHLLAAIRYVERNPLRANIVRKAENWNFSSLYRRTFPEKFKLRKRILSDWPIEVPKDYISFVNESQTDEEISQIRYSVNRGKPFGSREWTYKIIKAFGLESTIRNRGRQIKGT